MLRLAGGLGLGFLVWWAVVRGSVRTPTTSLRMLWTRLEMVRDRWGNTWQIATHSGRFTP
jgi:hypothetical protein